MCNTYYEYACTADVNYTYSVNGVTYQGTDSVLVTSYPSSQGGCLEDVQSTLLPIGITVNVYYQEDDHSKSTLVDRSIDPVIWTFCCGVCGGILLLTSILVRSRTTIPSKSSFKSRKEITGVKRAAFEGVMALSFWTADASNCTHHAHQPIRNWGQV